MIGKRQEYERMHATEQSLWWYQSLHRRVGRAIEKRFGEQKNIRVLDAGCGTGGLLESLRKRGYTQLQGLDASEDAVAFTRQRGFQVQHHNLLHIASFQPGETFDVIVCDDVLCYLSEEQIVKVLTEFRRKLRPGGIFISNNNAFNWLGGTHAAALNIHRRFVLSDLKTYAQQVGLRIRQGGYWSLVLFPPIALVRSWQNFQLSRGWVKTENLNSDVALPAAPINHTLNGLMKLEELILPLAPLGSSVFTVMDSPHD
ncbi:bifunctional 2-polyprenyl-6-hydroxyphenol methylase/3-demethylubiquinol 3-O-methyltransferase UbiG [Siphonobacter sp. SORGH_AS_1065]|uniref:class I SAM-dependent methyltransferase n=1 Tax=Siphonobacter sp. SORGH_AS_1065 TaxID=3041795 RepID=UPI0027826987|nr:class I SAM-dependent methyltransferase [Siphonobacter sp. SORGH_AS_1065]MDQ1086227.1 2-polyprenyl-3-methyl-5-hydroxy-6-metoxy-1,4-benzoquinol methylase [Siphonobacter sp. SORGH_AS_1065]